MWLVANPGSLSLVRPYVWEGVVLHYWTVFRVKMAGFLALLLLLYPSLCSPSGRLPLLYPSLALFAAVPLFGVTRCFVS